jgi:hypothetical protein
MLPGQARKQGMIATLKKGRPVVPYQLNAALLEVAQLSQLEKEKMPEVAARCER